MDKYNWANASACLRDVALPFTRSDGIRFADRACCSFSLTHANEVKRKADNNVQHHGHLEFEMVVEMLLSKLAAAQTAPDLLAAAALVLPTADRPGGE